LHTLSMFDLSLIIPTFNELTAIDHTLDLVIQFAATHPNYDFIFVDDGSSDGTLTRIDSRLHSLSHPPQNIRLIPLPENRGKGFAVLTGVFQARGKFICFMDGDLPYPLNLLHFFETELENADIVIGSRNIPGAINTDVPRRRKFLGWGFNWLARNLMGLSYFDTQAGFKGFRREVAQLLFGSLETYDFSFDVEILYLAHKCDLRVIEIPVQVNAHHSYKTSKLKLTFDSIRMLVDLFKIRFNKTLAKTDRNDLLSRFTKL